jgi:hypothetical protein
MEKNLDRLKLIGYLHDFKNIKRHAAYEQSLVKKDLTQTRRSHKLADEKFEQKLQS